MYLGPPTGRAHHRDGPARLAWRRIERDAPTRNDSARTDGSAASEPASEQAIDLAVQMQARLLVVSVLASARQPSEAAAAHGASATEPQRRAATTPTRAIRWRPEPRASCSGPEPPGANATYLVWEATPADAIVAAGGLRVGADLIDRGLTRAAAASAASSSAASPTSWCGMPHWPGDGRSGQARSRPAVGAAAAQRASHPALPARCPTSCRHTSGSSSSRMRRSSRGWDVSSPAARPPWSQPDRVADPGPSVAPGWIESGAISPESSGSGRLPRSVTTTDGPRPSQPSRCRIGRRLRPAESCRATSEVDPVGNERFDWRMITNHLAA